MYRIDFDSPSRPIPCTFVASTKVPGKILSVNEDGSSLVVLPNGLERPVSPDHPTGPSEPAGSENWDSPYTQGTPVDGFLVYRSADNADNGVPRAYRMLGA